MTDVTTVVANAAPGNAQQCQLRNYEAGEALNLLDAVYIDSNDKVQKADADASLTLAKGIGVVVASKDGETTVSLGDRCSVCLGGPVEGFSGATPNATAWVSTIAGGITETAPTGGAYQQALGRFVSSTCLWVNPAMGSPDSA